VVERIADTRVEAGTAVHDVRDPVSRDDQVVTRTTQQRVAVLPACDRVVAAEAADRVAATGADEDVRPCRSGLSNC
jgi:chitodextrinase